MYADLKKLYLLNKLLLILIIIVFILQTNGRSERFAIFSHALEFRKKFIMINQF